MGGNGNRGDGENGNVNDSMGVGRQWELETYSRTPLLRTNKKDLCTQMLWINDVHICLLQTVYFFLLNSN